MDADVSKRIYKSRKISISKKVRKNWRINYVYKIYQK